MWYHLTPLRMAVIKIQKSVGKDVEKLEPLAQLVWRQDGAAAMENSVECLQEN
jgi:hypothetical protein